jgi:hypothetical protein
MVDSPRKINGLMQCKMSQGLAGILAKSGITATAASLARGSNGNRLLIE